ncbi:MAG TPA: GWxTD domain-containing protein, partial [Thermoanaerobaculia bacterium]|nr:GWxTD domain-containing protein [Thermoanaerobaculia bacterium]
MKTFIRSLAVLTLMSAIATTALALSAEYVQFGQGPAQFLMTKEELAAWGKITTDADAKAFIDAFWARRDPRLKAEFDRRVKYADDNFRESKKRGALTER